MRYFITFAEGMQTGADFPVPKDTLTCEVMTLTGLSGHHLFDPWQVSTRVPPMRLSAHCLHYGQGSPCYARLASDDRPIDLPADFTRST